MTPATLTLLVRTIHLCREYHAGFLATLDPRYAWGLADAQWEIELLVRQCADGVPLEGARG